ncbi:MAG: T9SS type A sorting domain-containing protein [Candidatus Zixiibacteriota bacterium]|nr:MAG: T9SS type A sorting domain-containing protein [candidate division Zixibacteria bacterium]
MAIMRTILLAVNRLALASVLIIPAMSGYLFAGRPTQTAMTAASYDDVVYYDDLYIAANRWGVEILEISDDSKLVSLWKTHTRGRAEFVDAANGLVAVSNIDGVVELYYLNGKILRPAGDIDPGYRPVALKIIGDYLYVGGLEVSLTIYDISNPRFPEEISEVNFEGYPHDYLIRNDTLFIAAYHGGVVLLDIANPERPSILEQYNLASYVYGIALDGTYIYACAHSSGLIILDMTLQSMPPVIGYNGQFGSARKAVLTYEGLLVLDGFGGISMVDVSSPSQPQVQWGQPLDFNSNDFILAGDFLAVANWNNGFKLYGADLKSGLDFLDEKVNYSVCRSVSLSDGRVYAGSGTGGLMVFDQDLDPIDLQRFAVGENCLEVKVAGGYGFLSNDEHGITIIDISNPSNLKWISSYVSGGWVKSSALSGNILFLANWQGIVALDITDIRNPFEINFLDTEFGSSKIEYRNDTLFVAGSGGLDLYDVSNPNSFSLIDNFRTDYPAVQLEIKDGIVLLSSGLGGVDILSLTDGLQVIAHINAIENAVATEFHNGRLYVAENYSGISEWDVTQIDNPVYIRSFVSTGRAVDLEFHEGRLYAADYYGVTMFEVGINEGQYGDFADLSGNGDIEILSYPNPVNGGANIRFLLRAPGKVEISVFDILGRKVESLYNGFLQAGENTIAWDGGEVASGCYFVNVRGNGFSSSRPMTVIK